MRNRRSFLGNMLGLFGAAAVPTILTGNEFVPQGSKKFLQGSKKLQFLNACHRAFNCPEKELLRYRIAVFGEDFILPTVGVLKVERDVENCMCVFTAQPVDIKRSTTVQGMVVFNPEGIEIARNRYCSDIPCCLGDTIKNTYTMSA